MLLITAASYCCDLLQLFILIKCLNKAVAVNTDISEEVVATQFWHRVGVDLVRANCRAFHRRLVSHGGDVLGAVGPIGGGGGLQVVEGL